jgi:hypothetical protein
LCSGHGAVLHLLIDKIILGSHSFYHHYHPHHHYHHSPEVFSHRFAEQQQRQRLLKRHEASGFFTRRSPSPSPPTFTPHLQRSPSHPLLHRMISWTRHCAWLVPSVRNAALIQP